MIAVAFTFFWEICMTGYLSEVSVISKCTEHRESGEIIEYMELSLVMDEEPR